MPNNLNVAIDGHDASALVDTGAGYSVLSAKLSRRLRKVTTPWDGSRIRTAGGHQITPVGVVIDGRDAPALLDTGADYSVLSGQLSHRLRKVKTPWDGPQICTAGGHLITAVGRCTARVEIHGETCPVKFVVLQDCARDIILRMDFMCEYGAVIDLEANRLTLRKLVVAPEEDKMAPATVRVVAGRVNLPP